MSDQIKFVVVLLLAVVIVVGGVVSMEMGYL